MNANFSPRHSRSSCYLAPTPPRRKRSNDLDKILRSVSVPTHLQLSSCCKDERPLTDPRNMIFCDSSGSNNNDTPTRGRLQREKRPSKLLAIKTSSSMMFDHASQQRNAAAKAIVILRANSCDMKPSLPTRKATPVKGRPSTENNFTWDQPSAASKLGSLKHQNEDNETSAAIRNPNTKTNMFLQSMSSSSPSKFLKKTQGRSSRDLLDITRPPKCEHRTPPTHRVKTLRVPVSPNSVLEERRLSPTAKKEHLTSRWESSPLLSSAPACFVECFSDETTRLAPIRSQQRGVSRSKSSLRLESIML